MTEFHLFNFPAYDAIAPERVRAAVVDMVTLVRAFQFLNSLYVFDEAERFWAYKLPDRTGLPFFPTVEDIQHQHPEWDPRRGGEDLLGDHSRFGHFCQRQFLDRAAFLLNTPTEEDWLWLSQLAYRPDPKQRVWDAGPYAIKWGRILRRQIPVLSLALEIRYDAWITDLSTPLSVTFGMAHNWSLDAREAIGWKVGEPAPVEAVTAIDADKGHRPDDSRASDEKDLPDGPVDPPGFRWKNVVYPFTTSELRYHRLLSATWSLFRVRQKGYVSQIIDDYDRNGGASIERRALQNYARELSNVILPRFVGFPARLVVSGTAVYWEDLPCGA